MSIGRAMGEAQLTNDKTVGNYRIEEQIGRGGMGVVYRGRHLNLPREVAIKIVKASGGDDLRRQRTRFEREAFIQSQLDHPGIVKVYDYIVGEANYYIIMEYVEGSSLAELLARHTRGIVISRTLDIFQQLLAAVSYAHTFTYRDEVGEPHTGIIHRDLKPANILVTPDDHTKITDFGIVKLVGAEETKTFSRPYGTPQYVSPEQAEGRELDQRSDIYSLGIMLYELLTGAPPFGGRPSRSEVDGEQGSAGVGSRSDQPMRRSEILRAHVSLAPRSPSELNPAIGAELEGVVLRALAKNPEERFESAIEFARALRGATRSERYPREKIDGATESIVLPNAHEATPFPSQQTAHLPATESATESATGDLSHTARTSYVTQPIGELACATCGADAETGDRTCKACGSELQASPATRMLAARTSGVWQSLPLFRLANPFWVKTLVFLLVISCGAGLGYAIYRVAFSAGVSDREDLSRQTQNSEASPPTPQGDGAQQPTAETIKVEPVRVKVDSIFSGYNAAPLTDGVIDVARIREMRYNAGNWASAESPEPHWMELEFDAPVRLATIYLYWGFDRSRYMPSRRVELQTVADDANGWRTIATIEPGEDYDRTAFEFEPFTTRRIRILQPARMGPQNRPFVMWVREIEAYAVMRDGKGN